MASLNIAVIGCGVQGQVLIASLSLEALPGVRIQALCDIWPRNLEKTQKLLADHAGMDLTGHTYEDYRQLLEQEKDLHAVIIATPDGAHASQAIDCLQAGLHVYCEAPISNDVEQARQMVIASRKAGRLLQIGHQHRSNPYYRQAYRLLHETTLLGQLMSAQCESPTPTVPLRLSEEAMKDGPPSAVLKRYGYTNMDKFLNWRWFGKHGRGPLLSDCTRTIDMASWFLDCAPSSAAISGGRGYWQRRESLGSVLAVLQFDLPTHLFRMVCSSQRVFSVGEEASFWCGVNGFLYLTNELGHSLAHAEGWLPFTADGEHPWWEGVRKGYLEHLFKSKLIVASKPSAKETRQELTAILKGDRLPRYRSPSKFLDEILLRARSPTEYPGMNVFVLTPAASGNDGEKTSKPRSHCGPHLTNFIDAIRDSAKLNCPGETGYRAAAVALSTLEALDAGKHEVTFPSLKIAE